MESVDWVGLSRGILCGFILLVEIMTNVGLTRASSELDKKDPSGLVVVATMIRWVLFALCGVLWYGLSL